MKRHPTRARQSGFSLMELMVGIVIGLIALLAIYKTLAIWDSHSRTIVSGGDAQTAGTLAMFNLERDLKQAGMGFGIANPFIMGCPVTGTDSVAGTNLSFSLYPVQITTAGAVGTPDVISILSGSSAFFVDAEPFTASTATTKTLTRRVGFRNGDVAIVAENPGATPASATCEMVQVTDGSNVDGHTVAHTTGNYTPDPAYAAASAAARYNAAAGTAPGVTVGTMFDLGPAPELDQWSINNGRVLTRVDLLKGSNSYEIAEGVINMKAQYGVDINHDNIIASNEWTAATPADWSLVRAIRVAILVRSGQYEKPPGDTNATAPAVTTTAPAPSFADATTFFLMTNVDGTPDTFDVSHPDPNNWRFYRYRVYEKVIPLRNVIWGQ